MTTEIRIIDGVEVQVHCEYCPVCGEYAEVRADTGELIAGIDCGH